MRALIKLLRPAQWVKNAFVLMPAFFARVESVDVLAPLLLGFLSFSWVASGIYIFNDLADVDADRLHPIKSARPLAAGTVATTTATALSMELLAVGLALGFWAGGPLFLLTIGLYLAINVGYSFWLKKFALVDITLISLGFVLRVHGGGLLAHVPISPWMYLMTFLLAMLLALGKRRDDLMLHDETGHVVRKSVHGYSHEFIHILSVMLCAIISVAYILYTLSPDVVARVGSPWVFLTSVFVLLGLMRYLQRLLVMQDTGNPTEILLRDRPMQLIIALWLATFGILLYA